MHNYLFMVFFILLSLCIVGCDSSNKVNTEKNVSWLNLCPDFSKTGKAPVEQSAQCGTLDVAENPQDKSSKKIALNQNCVLINALRKKRLGV